MLQCELAVFSLDDDLEYKVLFYCWVDPETTLEIQLNGEPFQVRPILYDFLQNASSITASGVWIFIDAICINQDDVEERSSQVALIGDIYQKPMSSSPG